MVCAAREASAPHTENHSLVEWRGVPTVRSVCDYSWKTREFSDEKPFGRLWERFFSDMLSPEFSLKRVESRTNGSTA